MTTEGFVVYSGALSLLVNSLLAPIVYIKIIRKLQKIKPELKYAKIEVMPPIISHMVKSLDYAFYIVRDKHEIRDALQRGKVVCEFHFRKYCTKFDVFICYLLLFNTIFLEGVN